jgi:hypothetical protein
MKMELVLHAARYSLPCSPAATRIERDEVVAAARRDEFPWLRKRDNDLVERLVVILKLRKGTQERAARLIAAGPPFDPGDLGLARHAVYLGDELAIFAFEGEDVEQRVRVVVNDPVRSASFAAWVPLLAGSPALAHEVYYWEADDEP